MAILLVGGQIASMYRRRLLFYNDDIRQSLQHSQQFILDSIVVATDYVPQGHDHRFIFISFDGSPERARPFRQCAGSKPAPAKQDGGFDMKSLGKIQ